MGIQPSSTLSSPPSHLLQHYQIIQRSQNSQIIFLVHKQSKREHFMRVLTAHNQQQRDKINKLALQKISTKSEYLIELNQKAETRQEGYCSNQFKFYLIFQRPYKTLKNQIEERKLNNKTFSELQLLELLKTCIFGLMFLREIDQPHESISAQNIFLNKTGSFFLSDPWLNFQSNIFTTINRIYDSPERLEVKSNMTFKNINSHASDLFSVGMVLLEAIYLRSMNDAYNDKTINFTFIREKINKIPYPSLKTHLQGLLDYKPKRRLAVAFQIQAFSDQRQQQRWMASPQLNPVKQFTIKTANKTNYSKINIFRQQLQTFQQDINLKKQFLKKEQTNLQKTKHPSSLSAKALRCHLQSKQINIMIQSQQMQKSNIRFQASEIKEEYNDNSYIKVEENISILEMENQFQKPEEHETQQIISEEEKFNTDQQASNDHLNSQIKQKQQHIEQTQEQKKEQIQAPVINIPKKKNCQGTIMEVDDSENNSCAEENEYELEFVIQKYQIGSKYQGYKKNSMKNGKGKFSYHDGGYYEGMWKNDKMNGEGKLYYSSGKLAYQGQWMDDEFYGFGKVYNDSLVVTQSVNYENFNTLQDEWEYFQGNLVSDSKQGFGLIKFSSGEVFQGQFVNDKMEGKGKFHKKDGTIINGLWRGSRFILKL